LRSTRPKHLFPEATWLHGAQSTNSGSSTASGQICASIVWFDESIRCVVMTPFGVPVEPEVNSTFAVESGPTRAKAASVES